MLGPQEKVNGFGVNVPLKIRPGHFATNHAHINYYIDTTTLKTRAGDAREIARSIANLYAYGTIVDTIVCLEGMEVVGAYLAEELAKAGVLSVNAHKSIYVVTPEYNTNSQMIFRDNLIPEVAGRHVLILTAMVTTGRAVNRAIECVNYYHGTLTGAAAIFGVRDEVSGVHVHSVFHAEDIPGYASYDYTKCPYCRDGYKLDALVNAYGYQEL